MQPRTNDKRTSNDNGNIGTEPIKENTAYDRPDGVGNCVRGFDDPELRVVDADFVAEGSFQRSERSSGDWSMFDLRERGPRREGHPFVGPGNLNATVSVSTRT
ncbi:hypothetical protein G7Y89_g15598 [Cudoniella acicularis]|uniref:Uncharacterized protein n=1 Tax=Cudoniella acicularis TaxID=354080 RepID=A0A8H4QKG8_9HELO|nr:hypothetical protein G7Y89_g15598 [Cudoniella acicularis]